MNNILIKRLLLVFAFYYGIMSIHATNEMPIIAFWGVPEEMTSEYEFRLLSECGFNVNLSPYNSLNAFVKACRTANKYGVRVMGRCPEIKESPFMAANTLKKEPGFYGYYFYDEPSMSDFSKLQKEIEIIKETDKNHYFYINLLPFYKEEWFVSAAKTRSYSHYLQAASATPCQQISFDYYPILKSGLRENWYHNLEMVRRECLRCGKPFWGFALSVPHADYPQPTLGALRLQIYSNLAYGAQAIQYFTYWTPAETKNFIFHDAPISHQGKKTKTYSLVQKMNNELKKVSSLFYGAKISTVYHMGIVPEGTTQITRAPENLSSLRIVGNGGAVISLLEKDHHRYLVIVNKDYEDDMDVYITTKNNIPRHITKNLQEEPMKKSYSVAAGDLFLVRLR